NRLAEVFPGARILIVIREQRSMVVSEYTQYVREGGAMRPFEFIKPPKSKSMWVQWFDLRYLRYHRLISYYHRLFGPERVLTLTYEQFAADPVAFASEIGRFTGRPLGPDAIEALPFDRVSNPS